MAKSTETKLNVCKYEIKILRSNRSNNFNYSSSIVCYNNDILSILHDAYYSLGTTSLVMYVANWYLQLRHLTISKSKIKLL